MKRVGVAILGLGVVGGGTYKILMDHKVQYQKAFDIDIEVVKVLALRKERALALGIDITKVASSIDDVCNDKNVLKRSNVHMSDDNVKNYIMGR